MAILNFIKSGTYTRISNIHWEQGIVTDVQVDVFAEAPDNSYLFSEDYDDTNNMNVVEEQRIKGTRVSQDLAEPIHSATYRVTASNWDPDDFKKYFSSKAWGASNLHKVMYKWLLTLPAFSEASSDSDG
tara:strand:- start:3215 stop:3601 length:387 start_codon:yes stop_codon:yes gene_type:complete